MRFWHFFLQTFRFVLVSASSWPVYSYEYSHVLFIFLPINAIIISQVLIAFEILEYIGSRSVLFLKLAVNPTSPQLAVALRRPAGPLR